MRRRWILLTLLLLGRPEVVEAGARPVLNLNQIDISKPPTVRIYLTDLDSGLNPITDRKPQHYRLVVDGVPQTGADQLRRFHQTGEAVTLVMVMQVSPAMREALADAVEASKRLIDSLPRGSKVGLAAYADVVDPNLKPTTPATAKEAVDALRIREGVEVQLPDAIKDALEGMDSPSLPRQRLLVIISDGLTLDLNLTVFSELGRRAQDKGVLVHAIGYAPLEPQRLRSLHELTKRGGGTMREAREAGGVAKAFVALQEEIRNQTVVTYQAPTFFDGRLHDFQIETSGGGASNNMISIELPKVAPVTEGKSVFSSTWFLVLMLALGQTGLIVLVVLALRWRKRPVARPRQRADEDEEEEDEDEDEEREDEEQDDDEPDVEGEPSEEKRPVRRPRMPASSRSEREPRPGRGRRPPTGDARPVRGRRPPVEDDEADESTGVASPRGQRQGRMEALLSPNPALFKTSPEPSSNPDALTAENQLVSPKPPSQLDTDPGEEPRSSLLESEPGIPSLLPDPQDFLDEADRGLAGPAERGPGPVRRGGAAADAQGPGMALPDPDEFMRHVRGQPADVPRADHSSSRSGRPDLSVARQRAGSASPAVAGSGIPLKLPEVVPAALPPEAGVEPGRFLDRKTKVIAVEELSTADYVAWVVPVTPPHTAVVVSDGFAIGSEAACELRLHGAEVTPAHVVLRLDSRGFRAETTGSRGEILEQPLSDNDRFFVGSHELVFKVASRTSTAPLAAARLEVLDGMDQGRNISLPEGEVVSIGAHSSCQLVVRGHGVEKVHAIAVRSGQVCTISDLGSAAGIGYQGQSVGYRKIRSWEEVMIGAVRMIFILEDFGANEPVEHRDERPTWSDVHREAEPVE